MLVEKIFAIAHVADQAVLIILLLTSVLSVGMILERWFVLRRYASDSKKVRMKMRSALQGNSVEEVEDLARDPSTLEGRAAAYALRYMKDAGSRGLDEIFNSFALTERPDLEKSLPFLATVGSNAPYIGLFGTVLGIMKAFQDLAASPEAGQQTVMAGISSALIATALGLFVAIPAVIFYNYYSRQVRGVLQSLESVKEMCLAYAKKKGL